MAEAFSRCAFTMEASARSRRIADPARLHWSPHHAVNHGGLIGVAITGGAMAHGRNVATPERIEAVTGFADALLRLGCPLQLTVPMTVSDLADPVALARLEEWSRARGGAHGLIGFEVAAVDAGPTIPWGRLADLGYEVTLPSTDLLGGRAPAPRAARLAVSATLARRAPRDPRAAAEILAVAGLARALGGALLFRGDLTAEAEAWLGETLGVPATRQPETVGTAWSAEDLAAQVRDLVGRRDGLARAAKTSGREAIGDLTWVDVV